MAKPATTFPISKCDIGQFSNYEGKGRDVTNPIYLKAKD